MLGSILSLSGIVSVHWHVSKVLTSVKLLAFFWHKWNTNATSPEVDTQWSVSYSSRKAMTGSASSVVLALVMCCQRKLLLCLLLWAGMEGYLKMISWQFCQGTWNSSGSGLTHQSNLWVLKDTPTFSVALYSVIGVPDLLKFRHISVCLRDRAGAVQDSV